MAALTGLSLEQALLDYTNLYIRFGIGRDFDPRHPRWQGYLAGLRAADTAGEWTHRFYLASPPAPPPPGLVARVGCFAYARLPGGRIRLHFRNDEPPARAPLSAERRPRRMAELAALFARARDEGGDDALVVGASWLYNLEAYRRLFPKTYTDSARVVRGRFQRMPLWGQFVDRYGEIRDRAAAEFLGRLGRHASPEGFDACFPLPVIGVEAPIRAFHEFYAGGGDVERL